MRLTLLCIGILYCLLSCNNPKDHWGLITISQGTNMAMDVDPEEKFIIHDWQGALYHMDINGGVSTLLTNLTDDAHQPAISPNGRQVAFHAYKEGNWHIYTMLIDGSNMTQITDGYYDHREADWSSDGQSIIYSSDYHGTYDLWHHDLNNGTSKAITKTNYEDYGPSYSSNSQHIVFIRKSEGQWHLMHMDINTQNPEILYSSDHKLYAPTWDDQDDTILFIEHRWTDMALLKMNLESKSISRISKETEDIFPFKVVSIGPNLYYTSDGKIQKRTHEDRKSIPLQVTIETPRPPKSISRKSIIIEEQRSVKGIYCPQLSPNGDMIAFVALGDIWIKDLRSGLITQVTDDPFVQVMPTWTPDSKMLIYATDRANQPGLWRYDLASDNHSYIADMVALPSGIDVSPDNKMIAYTMAFGPRSGQLRLVNSTTGETRSIRSSFPYSTGAPTWHPNNKDLIMSILQPYSGLYREGIARLIKVNTKTGKTSNIRAPEHFSFGARNNDSPILSDDGEQLYFAAQGQIWKAQIDLNTNQISNASIIIETLSDKPTMSADNEHLLYISGAEFKLQHIATGQVDDIDIDLKYKHLSNNQELTIIHAGHVITMEQDGQVLDNQDIIIQDQKILDIVDHDPNRTADQYIDASNQYVMPGLIDMHAHQGSDLGTSLGYKWLSWGVTTTRDPATYPYDGQNRKEAQINGDILHPRIFYTGSPIDGNRVYYNGTFAQKSLNQINRELQRAEDLEFDLIKTYVRLSDSLQQEVISFAQSRGLPITSHEVFPATQLGISGVEHILGTSRRGYTPKMSETYHTYEDIVEIITNAQVAFTPTIGIYGGYNYILWQQPDLLDDQRLKLLESQYSISTALSGIQQVTEDSIQYETMFKRQSQLIKKIHNKDGFIVAGTDGPITPYGFGLFIELICYQEAGLSPYDVLNTATANAAKALNTANQMGTLSKGKLADLIILNKNPLEDVRNLQDLDGVMLGGAFHSLDDLLNEYSSFED